MSAASKPNTNFDVADQLATAASALKDAAARLDRRDHVCEKCHRTTHHNWTHAQVAKQLDGMVQKLGRLADELIRKAE